MSRCCWKRRNFLRIVRDELPGATRRLWGPTTRFRTRKRSTGSVANQRLKPFIIFLRRLILRVAEAKGRKNRVHLRIARHIRISPHSCDSNVEEERNPPVETRLEREFSHGISRNSLSLATSLEQRPSAPPANRDSPSRMTRVGE
jgi:hypothetical protein